MNRMRSSIACVLCCVLLGACAEEGGFGSSQDGGDGDSELQHPDGWTEETHGQIDDANYDVVFASDEVKRIDVVFAEGAFDLLQADMEDMLGTFGALAGTHGYPDEWYEACAEGEPGGDCIFNFEGEQSDGVCIAIDGHTCELLCQPLPEEGEDQGGDPGQDSVVAPALVPWNPAYVPCTVKFEDKEWWHVGMRYKGNSSLSRSWTQGISKLPFKLDFDEFEDEHPEIEDQRFYGLKKLSFASNAMDISYLREKVAGDLFLKGGVPTPKRAFYRVFFDAGEGPYYVGLYAVAEVPGKVMSKRCFGETDGNLYKPHGPAAAWEFFEEESFPKKNNVDEADFSDIETAIEALNGTYTTPEEWRAALEVTFNVDSFLQWLAINTVIQDWDTQGYFAHNYYLMADPTDNNRLKWVPWDHNLALAPAFVPLGFEGEWVHWPLLRLLPQDEVYEERIRGFGEDFIDDTFLPENVITTIDAERALITPYIFGDQGENPDSLLTCQSFYDYGYEHIKAHVQDRYDAAVEYLAGDTGGGTKGNSGGFFAWTQGATMRPNRVASTLRLQ